MDKRKGFTLIELLVVIAIIAVLMSTLMPALDRVKKQAKAVMCQSNLHELGIVFMPYTSDNNGHFQKGWTEDAGGYAGGHCWPDTVWPYYMNVKLRFCPRARKSLSVEVRKTFWAWITKLCDNDTHSDSRAFKPMNGVNTLGDVEST